MADKPPKRSLRQRMRDGRLIFKQARVIVNRYTDLWVLPLAGVLGMLLGMAALAGVAFLVISSSNLDQAAEFIVGQQGGWVAPAAMILGVMVLTYPLGVFAAIMGAAYAYALYERLDGRSCTRSEALTRAWQMRGAIARFTLVALLVGGILAVIGTILNKLRFVPWVGHAFQAIGTLGWATAAFFVVPVIVVERERGAIAALRSSASMAKHQWGKAVTVMTTLMLAIMVPSMVVTFLFFGTMFALVAAGGEVGLRMMPWLGGAFFLAILLASFLMSLYQQAFQVGLYRFARTGKVTPPFTEASIVTPFRPVKPAA